MIRLFNCDNLQFMKSVPDKFYELAIVDPPYQGDDAIGLTNGNGHSANRTNYHVFENVMPDEIYFKELKRISKNQIIWGGNFFGLAGGVVAWNKNGTAFGEGEVAICSTHKSVRFFEYTWNGMIQGDMKNKEQRIHPTQKPVALYKWLLKNYAKEGDKVFDSHGGSLSIAIACGEMGYSLDACELDGDYFKDSVARVQRHFTQSNAFMKTPEILVNPLFG